MPTFNAALAVPVYGSGMSGQLFNNEAGAAGTASQSLQYQRLNGQNTNKVWGCRWATPPTSAQVDLQCSMTNVDADFQSILTFSFSSTGEAPNQFEQGPSTYYRYKVISNTGGSGLTTPFQF